jgi:hypothetical protein
MTPLQLDATVPAGPTATGARRQWGWLTAVLVASAVMAAACSSSSSTATIPPPNPATAQADIAVPYGTLFNLANKDVPSKLATIQNGSTLQAATTDALNSSLSTSATGATVQSATILTASQCQAAKVPSPCAKVTYSILGPNGQVLLPNSTGYAAYVNGHWLVAHVTICGLFELLYQTENKTGTPQGC